MMYKFFFHEQNLLVEFILLIKWIFFLEFIFCVGEVFEMNFAGKKRTEELKKMNKYVRDQIIGRC